MKAKRIARLVIPLDETPPVTPKAPVDLGVCVPANTFEMSFTANVGAYAPILVGSPHTSGVLK